MTAFHRRQKYLLYIYHCAMWAMLYCAIWIICFKKNSVFRALALSIIPSMLFLFSGIMSRSVLLIIASVLFAPSHIVISYKNVKWYLQLPVWRTDKIPLGTKGRTSILSIESSASCGASFPVSRRKLPDRECFVTSFRQGGYTPLRRLCVYPLWTCRPQTA